MGLFDAEPKGDAENGVREDVGVWGMILSSAAENLARMPLQSTTLVIISVVARRQSYAPEP